MNKRAIIKVCGKVQGVFFRANCADEARKLNLVGWARNEPGGSVKILAEGEEESLKKIISYCQSGPEFAKVDKVEVKWEEATGEFARFEIKYD